MEERLRYLLNNTYKIENAVNALQAEILNNPDYAKHVYYSGELELMISVLEKSSEELEIIISKKSAG
jgi:hypothetical protein